MPWTKATDALPPDGEAVMVTVLVSGKKHVLANVRRHNGNWQVHGGPVTDDWLYMKGGYITNWAPMPEPAEDEEDL